MIQSKKAIGFFYGVGFLAISYLLFKTLSIVAFSDFSLFEWQIKQVLKGSTQLPYSQFSNDPNLFFFPIPNVFFHLTNSRIDSTFPNLYPILFAPIYFFLGKLGIQIVQLILFFGTIWLFHRIKRDHLQTMLLLFGSSLPIYIDLIHDTVFVFFLEIFLFYCFHKKHIVLASFISVVLVWMRPEFLSVLCLIPLFFEWKTIWKQYLVWFFLFLICFVSGNYLYYETPLPLRLLKNATFHWNPEVVLYLFRLLVEQIPVFSVFIILLFLFLFQKKFPLRFFVLVLMTCFLIILSPNTGGHNTPRYLYCLVPYYAFSIQSLPNETTILRKGFFILLVFVCIYSTYQWNYQTKELIKISKFQTNTLSALKNLKEDTFVFNNSDFSFVALPLIEENKNLVLIRNHPKENQLGIFLSQQQINTFVFLELPPSPFPIPNPFVTSNCLNNCEYVLKEQYPLPDTMLPIMVFKFSNSRN
ncbi:hypothetical protein AB3N60_13955 [Leptospira sp. WS39.C2]